MLENRHNEAAVMRQPFEIEVHKRTFINYLEIILLADGSAVYAVPSHQEKLIKLACERHSLTRTELEAACPREYYADYMVWLALMAEAVPVWNEFYMGEPNEAQLAALQALQDAKLLKGGRLR